MLITFIVLYLLGSVAIGLFAARRVHNTADYAVAGRSLPLAVVIATTFATWLGSDTVLGVSARFVSGNLGAVVEDPFGASMCLILVGLFFAYKLYQKNLITLGDHAWDQAEILDYIPTEPRLLRPVNYPPGAPGQASTWPCAGRS